MKERGDEVYPEKPPISGYTRTKETRKRKKLY